MSTPFDIYLKSQSGEKVTEEELTFLFDYITELEEQLDEADILIEHYAIETGDTSFDETEGLEPLDEAIVKRVKFNRSKRRTRRKQYRRNRAKIKMQQKRYRRTSSFRKAKRLRSRSSYRHKRYI